MQWAYNNSELLFRLIRFGLVGVLGTFVYYAMLWYMVEFGGIQVLLASSTAFVVVAIQNYLLHYVWTYASSKSHNLAFLKFMFMNVIGFLINWSIMYIGIGQDISYLIVQMLAIIFVVIWNYLVSSFWIFN